MIDVFSFQIVIASIMCSYNKDDWTELSKMAEVMFILIFFFNSFVMILFFVNKELQ